MVKQNDDLLGRKGKHWVSDNTIKSVRRIFEILELFDKERRPLAAKEIAKQLGYPLMSAHALLKSIHQLGYADFDPPNWTYVPSRSFLALLDWVPDILERERRLLDFVTELNQETKETVNISRQLNTQVRIIHGLESMHIVGVSVKVGAMMPATSSLTGLAALACLDKEASLQFMNNLEQGDPAQFKQLDRDLIDDVLAELSQRGTVSRSDLFIQGVGAVCLPVWTSQGSDALIVGVVGPSDRILANSENHRRTIKRLAKSYGIKNIYKLR